MFVLNVKVIYMLFVFAYLKRFTYIFINVCFERKARKLYRAAEVRFQAACILMRKNRKKKNIAMNNVSNMKKLNFNVYLYFPKLLVILKKKIKEYLIRHLILIIQSI